MGVPQKMPQGQSRTVGMCKTLQKLLWSLPLSCIARPSAKERNDMQVAPYPPMQLRCTERRLLHPQVFSTVQWASQKRSSCRKTQAIFDRGQQSQSHVVPSTCHLGTILARIQPCLNGRSSCQALRSLHKLPYRHAAAYPLLWLPAS